MIRKFLLPLYHFWIRYNKNIHFKEELLKLKKKSDKPIKKLPKVYKKQIIDFYRKLGFNNIDLDWHEYIYSQTGKIDYRFIPENFYHIIIEPIFTKTRTEWEDKSYMSKFLPNVKFPDTIFRNVNGYFINNDDEIISESSAFNLINEYDEIIIKPTIESGSGRGVRLIKKSEFDNNIFLDYDKNFIVQKCIKQHKTYSQFNFSSVNTEKIISFLYKGEVYILTSILRVGAEGAITDTASTGEGYTVGIREDGSLNNIGYSIYGKEVFKTASGIEFNSIKLEKHKEIIDIIKKEHKHLLYFGIISWDFAIDENGTIVLIEYNLNYPDVLIYQMNNGPLFGEMTELVLKECL